MQKIAIMQGHQSHPSAGPTSDLHFLAACANREGGEGERKTGNGTWKRREENSEEEDRTTGRQEEMRGETWFKFETRSSKHQDGRGRLDDSLLLS
jgi:hypothetical protein